MALLLVAASAHAQFTPKEGRHYLKLPKEHQVSGELTWLFWPGAKACAVVDEPIMAIAASHPQLRLHAVPVTMRPAWRWHAKIYYLAATSARVAAARTALWQQLQEDPLALSDESSALAFLQAHGVINAEKPLRSAELNKQLQTDAQLVADLNLVGVPAVRVGAYLTHAGLTANSDQFIATVAFLADKEEKEVAAAATKVAEQPPVAATP